MARFSGISPCIGRNHRSPEKCSCLPELWRKTRCPDWIFCDLNVSKNGSSGEGWAIFQDVIPFSTGPNFVREFPEACIVLEGSQSVDSMNRMGKVLNRLVQVLHKL